MFLEKNWALIIGLFLGAATLFFLMVLVIITIIASPIPEDSKIIVIPLLHSDWLFPVLS